MTLVAYERRYSVSRRDKSTDAQKKTAAARMRSGGAWSVSLF